MKKIHMFVLCLIASVIMVGISLIMADNFMFFGAIICLIASIGLTLKEEFKDIDTL